MVQKNGTRKVVGPWTDVMLGFGVFIFAVAVRLLYISQIRKLPLFDNLVSDSLSYDEWAQRIAAGDWLGEGVFYQAPLYPYFLGMLQLVTGHDLFAVRVVQAFLGAASCGLLFWAGKLFLSRSAGVWAALIMTLYAPAIFFDGLIQKTVLDLFLLTLLLVLLGKAQQKHDRIYFLVAGIVLGLLGLSRENALILLPVLIFWLWRYFQAERPATRLAWVSVFLVGLAVVLLPVAFRNLKMGGEFTLTTSQMGSNFFIGNNPSANGFYAPLRVGHADPRYERQDATELAEQALRRPLSSGEVSAYWQGRALEFIKSHPTDWLRLMGKKWLIVWNAWEAEDTDDFYLYQQWSWLLKSFSWLNFGVIAPLAAFGVVVTWRNRQKLWMLYLMLAGLAFSVALFYVFARYRFSIVPLVILFAGAGLAALPSLYRERRFYQLIFGIAAIALSVAAVQRPVVGRRGLSVTGYNNLGIAFGKLGMEREAVESYQNALAIDPTNEVVHYNLGSLLGLQGDLKAAGDHLRQAIKRSPDYLEARNNLGNVFMMQGDFNGAIEQYRKALKLAPAFKKVRFNLAVALVKSGDFTGARHELTQFVKMTRDPFEAYRANVLLSRGELDKGVDALKRDLGLPQGLSESAALARILIW
jgi:tetratricopeptide (TPR) repeat protein